MALVENKGHEEKLDYLVLLVRLVKEVNQDFLDLRDQQDLVGQVDLRVHGENQELREPQDKGESRVHQEHQVIK